MITFYKCFLVLVFLPLIASCRSTTNAKLDSTVICSLNGEAYFVMPVPGSNSYLSRLPSADGLCLTLKHKDAQ